MSIKCCNCGEDISASVRECQVCLVACGYPNVRAAQAPAERQAFERRYREARAKVDLKGLSIEFHEFEKFVNGSKAVMNRSLGALSNWINGESPLFLSFHRQVSTQGRIPNDSELDQQRAASEATINPFCYEDINYAALSLDGEGTTYYGPYSITLRTSHIDHRASLLERNSLYFNRLHQVVAGSAPPLGFKAGWADRGRLAAAKMACEISKDFYQQSPATLLMGANRNDPACDFVEVHILGAIHRASIERIAGPASSRKADLLLLRQALRKAKSLGIIVEVA